MYRPLTVQKVKEIRDMYIHVLHLREELRSEEALRVLVAAYCSVSPFDVDRVLDNEMRPRRDYRSSGIIHTWPKERIRRIF